MATNSSWLTVTPGAAASKSQPMTIVTFGYKHGHFSPEIEQPEFVQFRWLVCDVRRLLRNPYSYPELKKLSGLDPRIAAWIQECPQTKSIIDYIYTRILIYGCQFIAIGCSGGQHRSVVAANLIAERLRTDHSSSLAIEIIHRDLMF